MSQPGERLGVRALTLQQPFAAAMAAGIGLYTRRGKPTAFSKGEWVAVHCGQSEEHLKNARLMQEIRRAWPACPTDEALRAGQRSILGLAHFVDGACNAAQAAAACPILKHYSCTKPTAWRADSARACAAPLAYPKGNLQLWHLSKSGFSKPADCAELLQMACSTTPSAGRQEGGGGKRKRSEGSEAVSGANLKAAKR